MPGITVAAALFVLVALVGVLGFGLVVAVALMLSGIRHRREWAVPSTWTDNYAHRTRELQDPQFLDARPGSEPGASAAHSTAVAVAGLGISPFSNRAPLSVVPSARSVRHG